MRNFPSYLIFFLFGVIYCSDSINETEYKFFQLNDTLSINYHQKFINSEENISIIFDSLISDGRCPIDLRCFWEGDAEVEFTLMKNYNNIKFSLHTAGNYFTKDTVIFGYHVKLLDLIPYPHSKINYKPDDYSVKIIIE